MYQDICHCACPCFFLVKVKHYTIPYTAVLWCWILSRIFWRWYPYRSQTAWESESHRINCVSDGNKQTCQESRSLQSCSRGGPCLFHGPLCQVKLVDQSFLQSITPGLSKSKRTWTWHMCFCRSQRVPFWNKWHHPPVVCFFVCCCKLSPKVLWISSLKSKNLLWGTFQRYTH